MNSNELLKLSEDALKVKVHNEFFGGIEWTQELGTSKGKVDFALCATHHAPLPQQYILWAEVKSGICRSIYESFIQLILTIGSNQMHNRYLPPPMLAAFDAQKMAFLPFHEIQNIFYQNDFNWNVKASDYKTKEFQQLMALLENKLKAESMIFDYSINKKELQEFIKNNLKPDANSTGKIQINKTNFLKIYGDWKQSAAAAIGLDWEAAARAGIYDADFYLAELLSQNDATIMEKNTLHVRLCGNHYAIDRRIGQAGGLDFGEQVTIIYYRDRTLYHQFWNIYERPPQREFWDYMVARRDCLVPQDVRCRKGAFYTPPQWVRLSQQYLARALHGCEPCGVPHGSQPLDALRGYYIWDCAAGTGNLLEGLPNADGVFASTIDKTDVAVMHDRITNGNLNLWLPNVFQFDFLNDSLCDPKVPQALRNILQDPHKCRKLIIYINPPYAQAGNKRIMSNREEKTKRGVATQNMVYTKYKSVIGKAATELYALFFTRIKAELPKVILAQFSSMTLITGHNFAMFREFFKAKHLGGFVIHANSFDNVEGDFPIGFNIWDLNHDDSIQRITCDTYSTQEKYLGSKTFCAASSKILTHWISEHKDNDGAAIGALSTGRNDFAHQNIVWIENDKRTTTSCMMITAQNLNYVCIFYAVRHVIPHTWLNHNDQFLAPSAAWKQDAQFCNDCLVYTLFHDKNRIRSAGLCHWIPFTEAELGLHSPLCSRFMSNFLSGRIFSSQAKSTLAAGMALWRYYIEQPSVNINASWYDIREYFQGRSRSGRMNPMSNDVAYTKLMALLKESMHILAQTIENKVYKYEFLRT